MKLAIYLKKDDAEYQDVEGIIKEHLFIPKSEEEIRDKCLRLGFVWDSEIGIGDSSIMFFKYRIEERKMLSSVKKRILKSEKVVNALEGIKAKKDKKHFVETIIHEARLKLPWSRFDYKVMINDKYIVFVDCPKNVEENLLCLFGGFIENRLTFDPALLMEPIVDKESNRIVELCSGVHKFDKGEKQFALKGELDVEEVSSLKKATFCSTQYNKSIIFTMTDLHIVVNPKEFFKNIPLDTVSVLDASETALQDLEELVLIPYFKRVQDDYQRKTNEA